MNGDLISRSKLLDFIHNGKGKEWFNSTSNRLTAADCVNEAPAEDAEIVRHARWAPIKDDYGHHYQGQCTNCGCQPLRNFAHSPWLFCPNCGAKMDAKEDA